MILRYSPYEIPLIKALPINTNSELLRRGFIVSLSDNNRTILGQGEAAPLLGISTDSYDDVHAELQRLSELNISFNNENAPYSPFSSVQWAIESALLDSNTKYLSDTTINFQPLFSNIKALKELMTLPNHSIIKVKCGIFDLNDEIKVLKELTHKHPSIKFRLDFNHRMPLEKSVKLCETLNTHIDFVEDPGQKIADYKTFYEETGIYFAIECHEHNLESPLYHEKGLKALIYKPMLCSGLTHLKHLKQNSPELAIIISSCFESKIGLNNLAKCAALYSNEQVQGIGTASYLYKDTHPEYWTIT
jgi:O-succinylbenzoate synthase